MEKDIKMLCITISIPLLPVADKDNHCKQFNVWSPFQGHMYIVRLFLKTKMLSYSTKIIAYFFK